MQIYNFPKEKYDQGLLIDCFKLSQVSNIINTDKPFTTSFHEVVFITKGTGTFKINNVNYDFTAGSTFFLTPSKLRNCVSDPDLFEGFVLMFEESFIANFFNDTFFLYRFHYFYNNEYPPTMDIHSRYDFKIIQSISCVSFISFPIIPFLK